MNWFKQSISRQLIAVIGLGSVVLLAATLYGYVKISGSLDVYRDLIRVQVANERAITSMLVEFKTQVQEWKNVLIRGADDENREKYWARFQKQEANIRELGDKLLVNLVNPDSRQMVEKFLGSHQLCGPWPSQRMLWPSLALGTKILVPRSRMPCLGIWDAENPRIWNSGNMQSNKKYRA